MHAYLLPDYDLLKKKVEKVINERCFYNWEVTRIIYHLGLKKKEFKEVSLRGKVNPELKKSKLSLLELGIEVKGQGIRQKNICIYKESSVYEYLRNLDFKGEIELANETMEEIIDEKLHIRSMENSLFF